MCYEQFAINPKTNLTRADARRQIAEAVAAFLETHNTDKHAIAALTRLHSVARASDKMTAAESVVQCMPRKHWDIFFQDCITAERIARQHAQGIADAQTSKARAIKAQELLILVAKHLDFKAHPKTVPMTTNAIKDAEQYLDFVPSSPLHEALAILQDAALSKRRIAEEYLGRFSRKKTPEASRAAGIGWLNEAIERLGGEAKPRDVVAISTAVLGMGDVTPDAVAKAKKPSDQLQSIYEKPPVRRKNNR